MVLGKMMDFTLMFIVTITLVLLNFSPSAYSDTYVNLTAILSAPGSPFLSFLNLIQTQDVIQILEQQGIGEPGLTLFVPNDAAIARDNVSWGTLSLDEVQALLLFHAIPQYFSATVTDLSALSQISPVLTMAGLQHITDSGFTLNITFSSLSDTLYLNSGWTQVEVLGTKNITFFPTEIYQIDKVLMPEAIFGTNVPPPSTTSASSTAPSASTTSTPHKNKSGNSPPLKSRTGLSGEVIAGISTGGVVGALLVAACIIRGFYIYRKTKVPDDLSSTKRDVELHPETARAPRSTLEKSDSLGAPDTTSRRHEKLAKATDYQVAALVPVDVPSIGKQHWESLLSHQPHGASDGDKNTNTGGGISIGDKSIGGGINLEHSDIHANLSIGNTTVNVYQMLPTTRVGGDHLLTSH